MAREIKISFTVMGHVTQTVLVDRKYSKLSDKDIEEKLKNKELFTTIQENGDLIDSKFNVIGTIADIDNNCVYDDFEVSK